MTDRMAYVHRCCVCGSTRAICEITMSHEQGSDMAFDRVAIVACADCGDSYDVQAEGKMPIINVLRDTTGVVRRCACCDTGASDVRSS